MWEPRRLTTLRASTACYRDSFNFTFTFFNLCSGTLGTAATTGLLYQPRMIGEGDCEENGGMKIGKGNQSTRRKPAPAPLCPPQKTHLSRPGFEPGPPRSDASD
jgi:hypothetical protein